MCTVVSELWLKTEHILRTVVPVTRPSKSERTKESILGAAEVLFSEHGFDGTTLDAIGERVGIKGTAILYHYATKRELYQAVLDRMFTSMLDEVHAELTGDAPLETRLGAITATMVRFAAGRPTAARLLLREAFGGSMEAERIVETASRRQWTRFADTLAAEDQVDFDPLVVWNIVIGAICFYFAAGPTVGGLTHDPSDPERVAEFETVMVHLTHTLCGFDPA